MKALRYRTPADTFMNGLPVGNGRLGAMVLGDPACERLALNHEWLWRGQQRSRECPHAAHKLQQVRELLLAGHYEEGTRAGDDAFGGGGGGHPEGLAERVDAYQPAGDVLFEPSHGPAHHYTRILDLERAVVTITYDADGQTFRRDIIADAQRDLIWLRLTAETSLTGTLRLSRTDDPGCMLTAQTISRGLVLDGHIDQGLSFRVVADIVNCDGDVTREGEALSVRDAREVLVALNIGTSVDPQGPAAECRRGDRRPAPWEEILEEHVRAWAGWRGSWAFEADIDEPADMTADVTDERLEGMRDGADDPQLVLLYARYGAHLLQASTMLGTLPPNLQGLWNDAVEPPWNCDLHHDINLQMNLWPAEPLGMTGAVETLLLHIERMVPHARRAARDLYDCRGICFPLQTDPWGRCTPESFGWAVWIGAAPWLAQHLWWHWEFTGDRTFLQDRAYPVFRDIAAFYEDYLIEDDRGMLQIVPSQSPENRFAGGGRFPVTLCVSSAMDVQLAAMALTYASQSADILGVDSERRARWVSMLKQLPALQVGSRGQLLEWNEEFDEVEPQHRHLSHLIGLYPGDLFDPDDTPELWEAARTSLEQRLAAGGGHTGWSRAWVACLYARLGEGDKAWRHLRHLITDFATDTLLDLHPPRIFQIDGNFGGLAAVLAMVLQSRREEIILLPALPSAWPDGHVRGLHARGGFLVDAAWNDGRLTSARITATQSRRCTVRYPGTPLTVRRQDGQPVATTADDTGVSFAAEARVTYDLCRCKTTP